MNVQEQIAALNRAYAELSNVFAINKDWRIQHCMRQLSLTLNDLNNDLQERKRKNAPA